MKKLITDFINMRKAFLKLNELLLVKDVSVRLEDYVLNLHLFLTSPMYIELDEKSKDKIIHKIQKVTIDTNLASIMKTLILLNDSEKLKFFPELNNVDEFIFLFHNLMLNTTVFQPLIQTNYGPKEIEFKFPEYILNDKRFIDLFIKDFPDFCYLLSDYLNNKEDLSDDLLEKCSTNYYLSNILFNKYNINKTLLSNYLIDNAVNINSKNIFFFDNKNNLFDKYTLNELVVNVLTNRYGKYNDQHDNSVKIEQLLLMILNKKLNVEGEKFCGCLNLLVDNLELFNGSSNMSLVEFGNILVNFSIDFKNKIIPKNYLEDNNITNESVCLKSSIHKGYFSEFRIKHFIYRDKSFINHIKNLLLEESYKYVLSDIEMEKSSKGGKLKL